MKKPDTACAACGMVAPPPEYHPYLACLAFKACRNSATVRANLRAVVEYGARGGNVDDIRRPVRRARRAGR